MFQLELLGFHFIHILSFPHLHSPTYPNILSLANASQFPTILAPCPYPSLFQSIPLLPVYSYLSALRAVRVNTETPTEVSWMAGMSLQPSLPNTHSSKK